jgi:enoyl-CoA hydratase/carnithine racemase
MSDHSTGQNGTGQNGTGHIKYDVDGYIATITIDRPEKRNAVTYAMLGELIGAFKRAGEDDSARVVILTGVPGSFCAGTDLADLATIPGETRGLRGQSSDHDLWWPAVSCPKPVIAAVDGAAVGMGAEYVSQCDIRIATPNARFAWNFAHRGLVPDTGAGSWLLPRLIGVQNALQLLYSGDIMDAATAQSMGFLSAVVEPSDLLTAARTQAERFLQSSPMSQRLIKELIYAGLGRTAGDHMAAHTTALAACFKSDDHREGVASFLEKRPANFVGH